MPTRTRSLAPNTFACGYATKAVEPITVCLIKSRRVLFMMPPRCHLPSSPVPHGSIELSIYWQIGALVRKLRCQSLVEIYSVAGTVSRIQVAILEIIGVGKNFVSLLRMPHVFLYPEVAHRNIEVQGCTHRHGREIRCPMKSHLHVIHIGECGCFFQ